MRFCLVLFYLDFAVQGIEPKSSLLAQTRKESTTKLSCLLNNAGRFQLPPLHVEVFAVGFLCFLLLPEALRGHHIRALGAPLTRLSLHRGQQAGNATATAHHWERIGPWGCSLQQSILPACLQHREAVPRRRRGPAPSHAPLQPTGSWNATSSQLRQAGAPPAVQGE